MEAVENKQVNHIAIYPEGTEKRLFECFAPVGGEAVFIVIGAEPEEGEAIRLRIGRAEGDPLTSDMDEVDYAQTNAPLHGARAWKRKLGGEFFPAASDALEYAVLAVAADGAERVLGTGVLQVTDNLKTAAAHFGE